MDIEILLKTLLPLLLLIGLGYLSRRTSVLKGGDERVLNAYLYYFALPALFVIDLSEQSFTTKVVNFVFGSIIPVVIMLGVYVVFLILFHSSRNTVYLTTLSTIFGSTVFFGIPFISFAFPSREAEYLATLSAASIGLISVPVSITILEFYRFGNVSKWNKMKQVTRRLLRNPLIVSIVIGIFFSFTGAMIPPTVATTLHMLGNSTSVVAIFMLGVFLYGRKYENLVQALRLSLLRIALLPSVAFLTTLVLGMSSLERAVVILIHGTPVAVSMIVLSERYEFYKETIASLILISSTVAGLSMNIWLLIHTLCLSWYRSV